MGILNFIKNISPTELIIVGVVLFVLFGSKAITKVGKSAGETMREMKKIKKSFISSMEDDEAPKSGKAS